ncbi:hypothetical protein C8R45DRAFT_941696 [Mycena sanguinolenta]|nr:hypothetical protein C8R45DRAFT_941696 [Mycena sanguinolenta]
MASKPTQPKPFSKKGKVKVNFGANGTSRKRKTSPATDPDTPASTKRARTNSASSSTSAVGSTDFASCETQGQLYSRVSYFLEASVKFHKLTSSQGRAHNTPQTVSIPFEANNGLKGLPAALDSWVHTEGQDVKVVSSGFGTDSPPLLNEPQRSLNSEKIEDFVNDDVFA